MDYNLKPIFIFSLPRSGSTLLQKLLMTHKEINSVAEPWILLPFISTIKKQGIITNYSHDLCYSAIQDFISNIGGRKEYFNSLRDFILKLYNSTSSNNYRYFIDKTPRYYMIISDIAELFPNAKFIFLFRNPLSIYSSVLKTWHKNRFLSFHNHYIDLFEGPEYLTNGYKLLQRKSIKINYEDLVQDKESVLLKLCNYLEMNLDNFNLNLFKEQNLKGRMGDPAGIKKYSGVSQNSLDKWKSTFTTLYRKKCIKGYINNLSDDYLKLTNIDKESIIKEINNINVKCLGLKDYFDLLFSNMYRKLKVKFQTQNSWNLLSASKENSLYY